MLSQSVPPEERPDLRESIAHLRRLVHGDGAALGDAMVGEALAYICDAIPDCRVRLWTFDPMRASWDLAFASQEQPAQPQSVCVSNLYDLLVAADEARSLSFEAGRDAKELSWLSETAGGRSSGEALLVPVMTDGEFTGLCCFEHTDGGSFGVDVRAALESVGDLLELAVHAHGRRTAGDHLRRSISLYQSVVEDQEELVLRTRADGTFIFGNRALLEAIGVSLRELQQHNVRDYVPAEGLKIIYSHVAKLTPIKPTARYQHEMRVVSGEMRLGEWTCRAFFGDNGEISEFQAVGRDMAAVRGQGELRSQRPSWSPAIPQLPSGNLDTTAAFFEEQLGFRIVSQQPEHGRLVVRRGPAEVHFWQADGEEEARETGARSRCYVRVMGIIALHEEFKSRGVNVRSGPKVQAWGMTEMQVDDPYGNVICFGEPLP